ncbi:MAG: AsmA family protein, partial [Gluconacetobacter diazotrophicus]|nr:AsmA family protein [Gluconacetobacter diazotrophicus]
MRGGRAPWPVRVLAGLLLLPVVLLLAAEVALVLLLPDQALIKARIAAVVERDTGRALVIAGPLSVSPSWHPTVSLADVRLANLPGGTRPDMARAERISFQIALLPLLHHRVVVERLTLVGPNILFEEVSGRPNWVFRSDHGSDGDGPTAPAMAPHYGLRFRAVSVRNGMTIFRFPPRPRVIGIRSLSLQHPRDGGPLSLRSTLVYRDFQPFELAADADPTGRGADAPWHTRVSASAMGATAKAQGDVALDGHYALA